MSDGRRRTLYVCHKGHKKNLPALTCVCGRNPRCQRVISEFISRAVSWNSHISDNRGLSTAKYKLSLNSSTLSLVHRWICYMRQTLVSSVCTLSAHRRNRHYALGEIFFLSSATTCPCGLRGPPSWAWQECNRLLRLGRPWGAITLSRWCEWWYRRM